MAESKDNRSYALGSNERLDVGMTRIALGRAEKALKRLRGSAAGEIDPADAIHGARKDMKKLRSVLRLLRDVLPKYAYEEEKDRYRDAALALSQARDAEVKLQTLDALVEQADELPAEAVESWRQILDRDREAVANAGRDEASLSKAINLIDSGRAGIGRWHLEADEWEAINRSLTRVYRRGRRAMKDAAADPSETNLHQWRKRAKDLRYSLELLSGAWSGPLDAAAAEAERLTDLLGDHHDLAVLRQDLHDRRLGEEETRQLEGAIDQRQNGLAKDSLDLGRRLYAERPKDFSRRLGRYWEGWRPR